MDVVRAVKSAVFYACRKVKGLKGVVLDDAMFDTVCMSMGWKRQPLQEMEVFQLDRVSSQRELMPEVACIMILRPTQENLDFLRAELSDPKYREYNIFFSNVVTEDQLKDLAMADAHNLVNEVEELYIDFWPHDSHLFTTNTLGCLSSRHMIKGSAMQSMTSGLYSVVQSLKLNPVIRYQGGSSACEAVAQRLSAILGGGGRPDQQSVVLIVDRRADPITPLLLPWTYGAMVHDFFGLVKNQVDRSRLKDKQLDEPNFSPAHDHLLRGCHNSFFAQLFDSAKRFAKIVDEYQQLNDRIKTLSLQDMAGLVNELPKLKAQRDVAALHFKLAGELRRVINEYHLHDSDEDSIFHAQLDMLSNRRKAAALKALRAIMDDRRFRKSEKLRLVLLFVLRYEKDKLPMDEVTDLLFEGRCTERQRRLPRLLLPYAGRASDGRTSHDIFKLAAQPTAANEEETQFSICEHTPLLAHTLDALIKGALSGSDYPAVNDSDTRTPSVEEEETVT
ncbi:hypothetical protein PTSG_06394 [Salpingoeca rosetta]|uniref:Uncharacterized protein n=1 Tax=Salpingoeca rosetta (strain ATCC 50818 / BSB-021) TaxID=946362 RepID=F2UCS6_SALR5|nr:uncharacterized protein PTSG_06394 [Salpingoeca rosetta]EGD74383.1 hypothetical protein PTSG_06394 [Salpingoeca rosetta]|eukprot:XP_004993283.1 hypothetical protein PTSG_06394 [Salpingoeca rosetta]